MENLIISNYKKAYASAFYKLNKTWITEFWRLEKSDLQDLLNPEKHILSLGGEIFFAVINNEAIGTVAMIPYKGRIYELAKMTVKKDFRGNGVSKLLLNKCLDFAKQKKATEIFLISNRSLVIARKLYDSYGFKEISLNSNKYNRGNVKMSLSI